MAAREPKRLELQGQRSLEENLAELPRHCNVGTKQDSKGHTYSWVGYKLHLNTMDGNIPISALLTSASLHDSQAAIPLAQMSRQRVTNLYDLMDSAYDAPQIKDFSRQLGHVPIVDQNPRRGEQRPLEPARAERFKERSSAERVNVDLKDNYGGRFARVRGQGKVMDLQSVQQLLGADLGQTKRADDRLTLALDHLFEKRVDTVPGTVAADDW